MSEKYSLKEFENAIKHTGAEIEEVNLENKKVANLTAKINRVKYTWNSKGECYYKQIRIKKFDLKFN